MRRIHILPVWAAFEILPRSVANLCEIHLALHIYKLLVVVPHPAFTRWNELLLHLAQTLSPHLVGHGEDLQLIFICSQQLLRAPLLLLQTLRHVVHALLALTHEGPAKLHAILDALWSALSGGPQDDALLHGCFDRDANLGMELTIELLNVNLDRALALLVLGGLLRAEPVEGIRGGRVPVLGLLGASEDHMSCQGSRKLRTSTVMRKMYLEPWRFA
mmetsp:Transcript_80747/g.153378  ORF Transcript_80747/g.153378 Transcript_80747/m.153378 type:complete len:217 (+) Transcript_80747:162-812(+)